MDNDSGTDIYKLITENCPDLIYIVDFEEKLTYVSPSVKTLFGYEVKEVVGKKLPFFLSPQSYEKQKVGMLKVIKEKRFHDSETLTLTVFKKDGSKTQVEAHAKFILDESGNPIAILGIAREILLQKQSNTANN